ncbi:MAG: hypothetical protein JWN60_176 [Acidobacteria bacterium]|nr:hypothetical protein [Acidobacteriota bacterium]
MKNKSKLIIFALFLSLVAGVGTSFAQTADTPEQAAKSFYKWYTKELSSEDGDPIGNKKIMLKSVSKRLGKWIYSPAYQEYGADYIIDAQDFDESWQVTTTKAVIKGNAATLKVMLKSTRPKTEGFSQTLPLKMVKENGVWKIDSVNNRKLTAD